VGLERTGRGHRAVKTARFARPLGLALGLVIGGAPVAPTVAAQNARKGWNPMDFVKPADAELRRSLQPLQYEVTQHEATERPFRNEYWDNHAAGIYVDEAILQRAAADVGEAWP